MSRTIPFDTSQKCDICQIQGSFDFYGDYLCEKCFREDNEEEYDDELNDEDYCPCIEYKCGKDEELK